jgi:cyclopropane fatty-acyl-phospholipid synthase-like methyltransferase
MSAQPPDSDASGDRTGYWDRYYAARSTAQRPLPSQFATFVAGELAGPHRVIEFGCGTGRDAIFFASYGHDVIGVDASAEAVKSCQALAERFGEPASFVAARIDDPDLAGRLKASTGPLAVYARFFVHAITDDEERSFLDLAAELTSPGDMLAVEYRTVRDASGAKTTDSHYRRFLAPSTFEARTLACGFDVSYAIEGFGFAKYKQDDAYVARELFVKR